jgi:hypothetical protein
LLVTPSGLGVHGGSFDIDERILMEIMFWKRIYSNRQGGYGVNWE